MYLQNEAMATITSADGVGDVDIMKGNDDGEYLVPEEKTKKTSKGRRRRNAASRWQSWTPSMRSEWDLGLFSNAAVIGE
jgi:hypothetical protein